jgi:putative FmdB family regulatory protein
MPIYEYVCTECKEKFELLRPFSRADEDTECPQCNSKAKRTLSTICCLTTGENGETTSIGGSSCATCSSSNCATCGLN